MSGQIDYFNLQLNISIEINYIRNITFKRDILLKNQRLITRRIKNKTNKQM